MAKYNFQQIAAAWISKNNPTDVRSVLVDKGIIANISVANSLSTVQLSNLLYQYYLKNGAATYGSLLRQIPVNENISESDTAIIQAATSDIESVLGISSMPPVSNGLPTTQSSESFKSSAQKFWDLLVGGSTTTVSPVVTTTTKSSPLTIGLIIGGIAVVGILAWVIIKN